MFCYLRPEPLLELLPEEELPPPYEPELRLLDEEGALYDELLLDELGLL